MAERSEYVTLGSHENQLLSRLSDRSDVKINYKSNCNKIIPEKLENEITRAVRGLSVFKKRLTNALRIELFFLNAIWCNRFFSSSPPPTRSHQPTLKHIPVGSEGVLFWRWKRTHKRWSVSQKNKSKWERARQEREGDRNTSGKKERRGRGRELDIVEEQKQRN